MSKLDESKTYWLDSKKIYTAVEALPDQIEKTWERVSEEIKDWKFRNIDKIIVAGMGGSALGARVITSLGAKYVKLPIHIWNEFSLPGFVDKKTLVILISYSGNTEEVLSMAKDAEVAEAEIVVVAEGGKLAELANKKGWKKLAFDTTLNPGNQPRMAVGENISLIGGILSKVGAVELSDSEIEKAVALLRQQSKLLGSRVKTVDNPAKKLAESISDKGVVIMVAEHLVGAAHVFKNQLNENAKQWGVLFSLPELNHHLLEGMKYSGGTNKGSVVLFISSSIYSEAIKKRIPVVKEIVEKLGWKVGGVELEGENEWEQALELINFSEHVGVYTALCNGVDPGPIPWVDYLKQKLA